MTAPLQSETKAINSAAFVLAWYRPLVTVSPPEKALSTKRWAAGMVLPARTIQVIRAPRDSDLVTPLVWIHTFGDSYTNAAREADETDRRWQQLVDNTSWATVMPDGSTAYCEWAEFESAAHEEPYGAESVVTRFITEVRFGISVVPA